MNYFTNIFSKITGKFLFALVHCKTRWTYLGTYYFSSNRAHIELTDKSKGNLVYADAVMFVKK